MEQETSLANRVRNTVLDEYVVIRAPGLLSPEQLFDEVKHMFVSEGELIHAPWEECRQSMSRLSLQKRSGKSIQVAVAMIQDFVAWQIERGILQLEYGPQWLAQSQRALFQAGVGQQRAMGDSAKGMDHLLPPGLTPEPHVSQLELLSLRTTM